MQNFQQYLPSLNIPGSNPNNNEPPSSMNVEVTIRATGLPQPNTFAVITELATETGEEPTVLGKTDVVSGNPNPSYPESFGLLHELGSSTKVAISIFDANNHSTPLGSCDFDVDNVLGAPGGAMAVQLKNGAGTIHATMTVAKASNKGIKIGKYEVPTAAVVAAGTAGVAVAGAGAYYAYKKYYGKKQKNSMGAPGAFNPAASAPPMGGGAPGAFNPTASAPAGGAPGAYNPAAFNPSAGAPSNPQSAPHSQNKFVEYISGGCELNVMVAIDFTGSNGDPRQPGTLHSLQGMNDYEKAINAIVSILEKYDTDKSFPVVGFGAKYGGIVRHLFQCGPTPEAHGVQGVVQAYKAVFSSGLIMSGPTVFTEVIDSAAQRATMAHQQMQQQGKQAYTVLLILTDGAVSDVQATVQALDRASQAPLSVVIVGVGNADFSPMQFLDDYAANQPGRRDIAQFVPFNRHANSSVSLTRETLCEIPDQVTEYFQSRGIMPNPPMAGRTGQELIFQQEEEVDLTLNLGSGQSDQEIKVQSGGTKITNGYMPTGTQVAMGVAGAAAVGAAGYGAYHYYNQNQQQQQQQPAGQAPVQQQGGVPPQQYQKQAHQPAGDDFASGFGK